MIARLGKNATHGLLESRTRMPEPTAPPPDQEDVDRAAGVAGRRSSLVAKVSAVLFFVAVTGVECLVASLYIPTPAPTAAMVDQIEDFGEKNRTLDEPPLPAVTFSEFSFIEQ